MMTDFEYRAVLATFSTSLSDEGKNEETGTTVCYVEMIAVKVATRGGLPTRTHQLRGFEVFSFLGRLC